MSARSSPGNIFEVFAIASKEGPTVLERLARQPQILNTIGVIALCGSQLGRKRAKHSSSITVNWNQWQALEAGQRRYPALPERRV